MPGGVSVFLMVLEFGPLASGLAGLYRYAPNTYVRWTHAWAGGLFAAVGSELAKRGPAYVGLVPTYSVIYGAFATLPIFLLWIYISWVVVLPAQAGRAAPGVQPEVARVPDTPGYRFALAVALLRELSRLRGAGQKGLSLPALAGAVHVDPLQVEPVLESLMTLDWVARLDEDGARRHVLLADPNATLAALCGYAAARADGVDKGISRAQHLRR